MKNDRGGGIFHLQTSTTRFKITGDVARIRRTLTKNEWQTLKGDINLIQ